MRPKQTETCRTRRHTALSKAVKHALIENLEIRQMLSTSPGFAHPTWVHAHPVGNLTPLAASATASGVTPATMRKAYGIDSLTFGSVIGDGTGQTIAIVDAFNEPTLTTDIAAFDSNYGLAAAQLSIITQTGSTTLGASDTAGGWGVETALDVEWTHVMAPGAKILLVEAATDSDANLYAAVDEARGYTGVSVVSMSWGGDEASTDASTNDSHFLTPSGHQGVTFFASSGDNGAYSDAAATKTTKVVGYPAVSVNVVGVGGTTLTTGTGGVYSSETGWGNGTSSYADGGSGGGISNYAAQPAYQVGVVTQSTTKRTVPDVSLDADPASGVAVYSSYDNGSSTPWLTVGGTSLASPMWAGVMALVDQDRVHAGLATMDGSTQTLPALYKLPSADFHDITAGTNPYAAGTGYDLVTGRGSPVATTLVPDLAGVSPTPTIGSFAVSPTSIVVGTTITLTAGNVAETGGTASSVNFYRETNSTTGLQTSGTADTLVGSGTQSGTTWTLSGIATTGLAAGTSTFYAVANDATNATTSAASSATLTVTTQPTPVIGSFAVSPTSVNVNAGTAVTFTASNVTETSGTVSSVTIYRESNGTSGLQTATDTLVGTATASGTTYTLSGISTSGLTAGAYTYYALASDSTNSTSATASTSLTVASASTTGEIVGWEVNTLTGYGVSPFTATTSLTGVTNAALNRGSGVTTSGTAAANAWGGGGFSTTSAAGITANEFYTFGFTVGTGYSATLSTITMNSRRSNTGPTNANWTYEIGNGAWTALTDVTGVFTSTSATGVAIPAISLTGIPALSAGQTIEFRLTPYGASGNLYVNNGPTAGDDLTVTGTLSAVTTVIPTIGSFAVAPTSVVTNAGTTISLSASNVADTGGTVTGVNFYRETNSTSGLQISSDTLVGAGTVSGSTWTLSGVSTAGLAAGTYTYYAVATDGTNNSLASSATLNVTATVVPTIGSFAVSPTSVNTGAASTITLTAGNVTEVGGTITGVNFYRESNSTTGLQIGGDTLVGAGTQSGTTWALSGISTSALTAGTYTYYAVAVDSSSVGSATSSATLSVVTPSAPTIGTFAVSPTAIASGGSVTLTASNVTETGGTITAVNFYLESNSTTGLQTAGDTLIGTGTQSGTTWTISASTTGLAAGTYTYYAVATDSTSVTSAVLSATLSVTAAVVNNTVLGWDTNGQSTFGTQNLTAGTLATGLTNSTGLTRGSAVTVTGTPAANAWGGANWSQTTSAAGIAGNESVTFGMTVSAGYSASLSSIDMNYRRSGSGPANGYWEYQLNSGTWTMIADVTSEFSVATSGGGSIAELPLTSITALQSLPSGSVVNFRVTPYAATGSTGTWYVYGVTAGNDLEINGTVTVVNPATPLTLAGPANYLMLDNDGLHLDVWNGTDTTGTIAQQLLLTQVSSITYTGTSGDDNLTVDFSNGDPLPASGITFNGGVGGTNTLNLFGSTGNDAFVVNATSANLTNSFGTIPIGYSNTTALNIDGGAGSDTITQSAQPGATLTFGDPTGEDVLNVDAGSFTLPAAVGGSDVTAISLDTLHIESGATVVVGAATSHSLRSVLVVGTLEDAGTLDLKDNDFILHQADYANVLTALKSGLNNGNWNGTGIISSAAASDSTHLTTLALIQNNDGNGNALYGSSGLLGTFDGQDAATSDLILKYTYYGDTNLSGVVDGTDYGRIDSGFVLKSIGWFNGDFNYDGTINGSDYTLIDNAFNTQGSPLTGAATSSIKPAVFSNWSAIQGAIAKVPTNAGQLASVSVVNFGSTVYTGPLNVANTLTRIRADGTPVDSDDGSVYTNPQASGLAVDGTYYEFVVKPSGGTDQTFSGVSSPGPMRILLATGGDCYFTGDHYVTFVPVYIVGQNTPTISTFAVNPTSVVTGASVSLSATGVAETSGTISSVKFYRETNSTTGLQTTDTLVGSGTQSGTTWTLSNISTTSFTAGSYTFYAVATDTGGFNSSTSVTTLTVTGAAATNGAVLAFSVNGQNGFGQQGLGASTIASGVTNSTGLTRGSGVSTAGTSASNAWGGSNWSTGTSATGISSSEFITFGLTVSTGFKFSASSIDLDYRRSTTGPANGLWQYELNSGTWVTISDVGGEFSNISTAGASMTELNLSGVSALQSLAAGTNIQFRLVPYAASTNGGTWYLYNLPGNDLTLNGAIAAA